MDAENRAPQQPEATQAITAAPGTAAQAIAAAAVPEAPQRDEFEKCIVRGALDAPLLQHYDVGILVDSREKISHRERAQALRERLVSHGLRSEVIQLPVGDFLAVAIPKGGGSVEESSLLVLDTVVERKVLCDFKATIAAKRHYHSQKVRLSRCGLSRPFYLVEGHLDRWPHQQERQRMSMELSRIEMSDGLLLHLSRNTDETIKFLKSAQQRLSRVLSSKTAREARSEGLLTTYAEFKERTSPPEAISFAFGRMLLNIHGLSAEMVANILQRHPTPRALAEALDSHGRACDLRGLPPEQRGWLLAEDLVPGKKRRKLAGDVTRFFCDEDLPVDTPLPDSQTQDY